MTHYPDYDPNGNDYFDDLVITPPPPPPADPANDLWDLT